MDELVIEIDVLVIGGGVQGLLLLHELTLAGRSCVLVANSDLGGGQTLHSHGVLNTGFGFSGPDLREIRDRLVLPFLRERHIDTYGDWFLVTPGDVPVGVPVTTDSMPKGFEAGGAQVLRLHELNIPTRRVVETLTNANLDRIVHGHVTNVRA